MTERDPSVRPAGELVFSDDELADMRVALASDPNRVRRKPSRASDEAHDGPVSAASMATVRQPAFSPLDMIVEAAFARVNGVAASAASALESPWEGAEPEPVE